MVEMLFMGITLKLGSRPTRWSSPQVNSGDVYHDSNPNMQADGTNPVALNVMISCWYIINADVKRVSGHFF